MVVVSTRPKPMWPTMHRADLHQIKHQVLRFTGLCQIQSMSTIQLATQPLTSAIWSRLKSLGSSNFKVFLQMVWQVLGQRSLITLVIQEKTIPVKCQAVTPTNTLIPLTLFLLLKKEQPSIRTNYPTGKPLFPLQNQNWIKFTPLMRKAKKMGRPVGRNPVIALSSTRSPSTIPCQKSQLTMVSLLSRLLTTTVSKTCFWSRTIPSSSAIQRKMLPNHTIPLS